MKQLPAEPMVTAVTLASRMRWSYWTGYRRMRQMEAKGMAVRVGRQLQAPARLVAEHVPGFSQPSPLERTVTRLLARIEELERRFDQHLREQ